MSIRKFRINTVYKAILDKVFQCELKMCRESYREKEFLKSFGLFAGAFFGYTGSLLEMYWGALKQCFARPEEV